MRDFTTNQILEKTIARERLTKYLAASGGDLNKALGIYEQNSRMSEAFYTPLQCLEVCLRNSLNIQMADSFGADWFTSGNAPLAPDAIADINSIISELNKQNRPVATGAIIAELRFNFWVSLLGPRYDATLWRQCLYRAFTENGLRIQRKKLHGRINAIRRFRNRIAHHEPIFLSNPMKMHTEVVEAIGWMCSITAAWTLHLSRFPSVYGANVAIAPAGPSTATTTPPSPSAAATSTAQPAAPALAPTKHDPGSGSALTGQQIK